MTDSKVVALIRPEASAVTIELRPDKTPMPWDEIERPCLNTIADQLVQAKYQERLTRDALAKATEVVDAAHTAHKEASGICDAAQERLDRAVAKIKGLNP
jgi:hypothetical protein